MLEFIGSFSFFFLSKERKKKDCQLLLLTILNQKQDGMGSPDDANLQRIANQNRMLNNDGTYRGLGLLDRAGGRPLDDDDKILYFYKCPIMKRLNHRKHNSHHWFFDSICEGLEDRST
jgi:hypothetical protein